MVNKGGCLKGRVKNTPNGGCKIGKKNKPDSLYNKRKVTGVGKKMMVEIDGKAKPKRKVKVVIDTKKRTVKKATHKMSDGAIHTGKKHTKDSKVVKKAPAKRVSKPKAVKKAKPTKSVNGTIQARMSSALCGKAPASKNPIVSNAPRGGTMLQRKGGGDKVRPKPVYREDFKKKGIRRITVNKKDGSKVVKTYDMGVPANSPMRVISEKHILTSGARTDRVVSKTKRKIRFTKKKKAYSMMGGG